MKEIRFRQMTNNGEIKGVLRIIGKILYYKYSDSSYAKKVISQMRSKGINIEFSDKNDWIKVDFIKDSEIIKLGVQELDLREAHEHQIEDFIFNFYMNQYKKLNFIIDETI